MPMHSHILSSGISKITKCRAVTSLQVAAVLQSYIGQGPGRVHIAVLELCNTENAVPSVLPDHYNSLYTVLAYVNDQSRPHKHHVFAATCTHFLKQYCRHSVRDVKQGDNS